MELGSPPRSQTHLMIPVFRSSGICQIIRASYIILNSALLGSPHRLSYFTHLKLMSRTRWQQVKCLSNLRQRLHPNSKNRSRIKAWLRLYFVVAVPTVANIWIQHSRRSLDEPLLYEPMRTAIFVCVRLRRSEKQMERPIHDYIQHRVCRAQTTFWDDILVQGVETL